MEKYIITVLSQNNPGVLSRISSLLRRKMFNISSLTVGQTDDVGLSRFTIVALGNERQARKIARNIENLIEVLKVKIIPMERAVTREISLVKVQASSVQDSDSLFDFPDISVTVNMHGAEEMELEVIDRGMATESFMKYLEANGVVVRKWVRSGIIAVEGE